MVAATRRRETSASQRRASWRHPSRHLTLIPIAAAPVPAAPREGHARGQIGAGWFDSSWELRRGLEVREECAADVELRAWVDQFVRPQRTTGRIASPSASTAIA
jgi:hypothetical protein